MFNWLRLYKIKCPTTLTENTFFPFVSKDTAMPLNMEDNDSALFKEKLFLVEIYWVIFDMHPLHVFISPTKILLGYSILGKLLCSFKKYSIVL